MMFKHSTSLHLLRFLTTRQTKDSRSYALLQFCEHQTDNNTQKIKNMQLKT